RRSKRDSRCVKASSTRGAAPAVSATSSACATIARAAGRSRRRCSWNFAISSQGSRSNASWSLAASQSAHAASQRAARFSQRARRPRAARPRGGLGAQGAGGREGAAEPAGERDEREDIVAVVVEDPRQRRGPPGAEEVEVERRNQGARHVVLALEPDDLALERREPAVGAAGREDAAGRPEEVEMGQQSRPAAAREDEA